MQMTDIKPHKIIMETTKTILIKDEVELKLD